MTAKELAAAEGISYNTAKVRVWRAKKKGTSVTENVTKGTAFVTGVTIDGYRNVTEKVTGSYRVTGDDVTEKVTRLQVEVTALREELGRAWTAIAALRNPVEVEINRVPPNRQYSATMRVNLPTAGQLDDEDAPIHDTAIVYD